MRTTPRRHPRWAVAAAIGCALLLAACGSSSHGSGQTGTGSSQSASLMKYSECMRSHGVADFPDPSRSQSGNNSFGVDGYTFNLPANLNVQSPAYQTADKTCGKLIGIGSGSTHTIPEKAKEAALAHARCMRQHGVPNYPDPTFTTSGGSVIRRSGGGGLNPRSPAFQQAQKICAGG